jgi:hypothetical protein
VLAVLVGIAATSVLAAPPVMPIQHIYAPTPTVDPRVAGLEFDKAAEEPLHEAPGIHVGGFMVFPELEIGERYDDNIFATKNGRESDFYTVISPSVSVESTWSRHGLGACGLAAQASRRCAAGSTRSSLVRWSNFPRLAPTSFHTIIADFAGTVAITVRGAVPDLRAFLGFIGRCTVTRTGV